MRNTQLAAPCWGIKPGYIEHTTPVWYEDDVPAIRGITFQPDVYPYARDLALLGGYTTIVDIGCGHADKLAKLHAENPELIFIGIDYGTNIAFCEDTYSGLYGYWFDVDLEQPGAQPWQGWLEDAVVICADVIEHLVDPRPLLQTFGRSHAATIVLSTPDRAGCYPNDPDHHGPPNNLAHIREWTGQELYGFVTAQGLDVVHLGNTRSNDEGDALNTLLLVATPGGKG